VKYRLSLAIIATISFSGVVNADAPKSKSVVRHTSSSQLCENHCLAVFPSCLGKGNPEKLGAKAAFCGKAAGECFDACENGTKPKVPAQTVAPTSNLGDRRQAETISLS